MRTNGELPPWKPQPSSALRRLHEAAIAAGRNPLAPSPVVEVPSARPPITEFTGFPKPNWDQVIRAEKAAERAARIREAAELLETVEPPEQPTPPAAARKRGWRRSTA